MSIGQTNHSVNQFFVSRIREGARPRDPVGDKYSNPGSNPGMGVPDPARREKLIRWNGLNRTSSIFLFMYIWTIQRMQ